MEWNWPNYARCVDEYTHHSEFYLDVYLLSTIYKNKWQTSTVEEGRWRVGWGGKVEIVGIDMEANDTPCLHEYVRMNSTTMYNHMY